MPVRKTARKVERRGSYARAWSGGAMFVDPFSAFPEISALLHVTADTTQVTADDTSHTSDES